MSEIKLPSDLEQLIKSIAADQNDAPALAQFVDRLKDAPAGVCVAALQRLMGEIVKNSDRNKPVPMPLIEPMRDSGPIRPVFYPLLPVAPATPVQYPASAADLGRVRMSYPGTRTDGRRDGE